MALRRIPCIAGFGCRFRVEDASEKGSVAQRRVAAHVNSLLVVNILFPIVFIAAPGANMFEQRHYVCLEYAKPRKPA